MTGECPLITSSSSNQPDIKTFISPVLPAAVQSKQTEISRRNNFAGLVFTATVTRGVSCRTTDRGEMPSSVEASSIVCFYGALSVPWRSQWVGADGGGLLFTPDVHFWGGGRLIINSRARALLRAQASFGGSVLPVQTSSYFSPTSRKFCVCVRHRTVSIETGWPKSQKYKKLLHHLFTIFIIW